MKTNIDIILRNIAKIRRIKDLKQAEMARLLNMTQSNYAMIETGRRSLTVPLLLQIVINLNVDVEELLYEEREYPPSSLILEMKTDNKDKLIESLEMNVNLLTEKLKRYEETK